jgi:hypothetical protein
MSLMWVQFTIVGARQHRFWAHLLVIYHEAYLRTRGVTPGDDCWHWATLNGLLRLSAPAETETDPPERDPASRPKDLPQTLAPCRFPPPRWGMSRTVELVGWVCASQWLAFLLAILVDP